VKTDSIFYRFFQELPGIFFELIGNTPETANNYQFSSVEIKQTAFRLDGVFLPAQGDENPIYFVEVQFQPDAEFYSRFLTEIFLYLRQNQPQNHWCAVVLYPSRSVDTGNIRHYREFFASQRVRRVYLNELGEASEQSIGIGTVSLVILPEARAVEQARILIERVRQEIADEFVKEEYLQLIETIIFYKLPSMSREEIAAMFGMSELKQSRVYQEALQEGREEGELIGKLKAVPRLLAFGLGVEQVAEALGLEVEQVRQVAQNVPSE
jgi:predicted transposase/invertase (TIGR01784 family)